MTTSKIKLRKNNERNIILIILGLVLIFLIGYIFWDSSNKKRKALDTIEEEPETVEYLTSILMGKTLLKVAKEVELQNVAAKRNKYFIYARLCLVIIMIGVFLSLQFLWIPEFYKESHWFDNLRNFITAIILGFTTIAFIAKGNLKSFKESIEGMAAQWFFKDEATLQGEIQMLDSEIIYLEDRISQIERKNSNDRDDAIEE